MNRRLFLASSLAGLASLASGGAWAKGEWVSLYNGRDLSGWHVQNGKLEAWKADGEILSCVLPGGGWLTTDREYGDFVLALDYRIPEGGNSGVGIRYPSVGDPAHKGMEIQILDDDAAQYRNLKPAQYTGGIYYQAPPFQRAARKPGEWNSYVIRAHGPMVTVHLNGELIQFRNVDEFTTGEGGHTPLAERPKVGHVGLQSHGHRVDFRNLRIREL